MYYHLEANPPNVTPHTTLCSKPATLLPHLDAHTQRIRVLLADHLGEHPGLDDSLLTRQEPHDRQLDDWLLLEGPPVGLISRSAQTNCDQPMVTQGFPQTSCINTRSSDRKVLHQVTTTLGATYWRNSSVYGSWWMWLISSSTCPPCMQPACVHTW
jgi:hypothetical protein